MENNVKIIVIRSLSYKIKFIYSKKLGFLSYICTTKTQNGLFWATKLCFLRIRNY